MAELQHFLGSIFRDIAQARFTSDIYSRNISKYYEQDPLLRRFPTPRTDVDEVEVDLKFVLSGLEQTAAQDEGREASIESLEILEVLRLQKNLTRVDRSDLRALVHQGNGHIY